MPAAANYLAGKSKVNPPASKTQCPLVYLFSHLCMQIAPDLKDWFLDSLQVGIHLTRKMDAARDSCNGVESRIAS